MERVSETGNAGRYARTTNGLIGSLVVTLLAVGAFVVFRAVTSTDLDVRPEPVNYLESVELAQGAGLLVAYPDRLPEGWIATSVEVVAGDRPQWGLGMLTGDGSFVGIRQEDESLEDLLETYVDPDARQDAGTFVSDDALVREWQGYSDAGGDHAYAGVLGEDTLLVYGSASSADQQELISLLTTDLR